MSKALQQVQMIVKGAVSAQVLRRDISTIRFIPPTTYKKKPEEKKFMCENVFAYCAETGIDALGAEKAVISGSAHMPQKQDDPDPWERLTVKLFDKEGKAMILKDPTGETYERIHIATDKKNWHREGYFRKA